MRLRQWLLALMLVAAAVTPGSFSRAQEGDDVDPGVRASARQLAREGQDRYREGDYAGALDRYERAVKLVDVPTVHVRVARCLVKLGRLVQGAERYRAVIRQGASAQASDVIKASIEDARSELEQLRPRIPWALVTVLGEHAGALVELDGRALPQPLWGERTAIDPGTHQLVARRGQLTQQQIFTVEEGKTVEVTITVPAALAVMPPPPAPPPPTPFGPVPPVLPRQPEPSEDSAQPLLGWTLLSVGGAGLIAGAVVGGLAVAGRSDLEGRCGAELQCPPDAHDDADRYNAMRISTTVLLVAGAGLAATGVVTVLTTPSKEQIALTLSPTAVGLRLSY